MNAHVSSSSTITSTTVIDTTLNIDSLIQQATASSTVKQQPIEVTQAAQNISLFLDEFKIGKKSNQQTLQLIIGTIKASYHQQADSHTSESSKRELLVESVLNITGIREEDNKDVELISDIEEKKKVAPLLTGFGIPLYSKIISVLLWEITKINN